MSEDQFNKYKGMDFVDAWKQYTDEGGVVDVVACATDEEGYEFQAVFMKNNMPPLIARSTKPTAESAENDDTPFVVIDRKDYPNLSRLEWCDYLENI